MTYKPNQSTPLLSQFTPSANATIKSQDEQEIELFINKVVQKLLPIYKDYPENVKKISRINREKIRQGLLKVTEGKIGLKTWFDNMHTILGRHPVDLAKILYESTDGLKSKEAQQFKQGCFEYYKYISNFYNAGLPTTE